MSLRLGHSIAAALLASVSYAAQAPAPEVVEGPLASRIDEYLTRCVPFGFSGSVLVGKNAKILLCRGYGIADRKSGAAATADTLFDIGSLSQQFTASLLLALERRGDLKVTDTIDRFLGEVPVGRRRIQIQHLLAHTSGLPRELATTQWDESDRWTGKDLPLAPLDIGEREALVRAVLDTPLQSEPGEKFEPSNIGYELLAAIAEIAAKQPFDELMQDLVFAPAGLENTGVRRNRRLNASLAARGVPQLDDTPPPGSILEGDPARFEGRGDEKLLAIDGWYSWGLRGAGGVLTTARDLWKWERALRGDSILDAASRKRLFTPVAGEHAYAWYEAPRARGSGCIDHGNRTANGFDAVFIRRPDQHLFIAVLGNAAGTSRIVSDSIERMILNHAVEMPPPTIRLSAVELQAWCGEFTGIDARSSEEVRFRVRAAGSELMFEALSWRASKLLDAKSGRFRENVDLVERSREIASGLARDNLGPLRAAGNSAQWSSEVELLWQSLLLHHGRPTRATVVGEDNRVDRDVKITLALDFERGSEILELGWTREGQGSTWIQGSVSSLDLAPPYESRVRLVPESATSAVPDLIFGPRVMQRVTLSMTEAGAALWFCGVQLKR